MEAWQKIDELVERAGAQAIVDELKQWLPSNQLEKFADDFALVNDYEFSDEIEEEE